MLKPNDEICLKWKYQLKQENISRKKKVATEKFNLLCKICMFLIKNENPLELRCQRGHSVTNKSG